MLLSLWRIEIVVVNPKLGGDEETQNGLVEDMGVRFVEMNARHVGGCQDRRRRLATNIADVRDLPRKSPVDPNVMLECMGSEVGERWVQTVLARGNETRDPVMVWDVGESRLRGSNPMHGKGGYARVRPWILYI